MVPFMVVRALSLSERIKQRLDLRNVGTRAEADRDPARAHHRISVVLDPVAVQQLDHGLDRSTGTRTHGTLLSFSTTTGRANGSDAYAVLFLVRSSVEVNVVRVEDYL
jgi:hypothetical protein